MGWIPRTCSFGAFAVAEPAGGGGRVTPRVSVVIPTRNRAESLSRAVASMLAQTLQEWELLIVDDGSEDDTGRRVEEWQLADVRVRGVRHVDRKGGGAARNSGLRLARAPWIAFLDDDAEWMPTKLAHQLALAHNARRPALVHAPVLAVEEDGSTVVLGGAVDPVAPFRTLAGGNRIDTAGVLVDRAAVADVGGFDPEMPRLQDWDLWLRLCGHVAFTRDEAVLARTFRIGTRISTDPGGLRRAAERLIRKHPSSRRLRTCLGHMLVCEGEAGAGVRMLRGEGPGYRRSPSLHARLAMARFFPGGYRSLARASERWRRSRVSVDPWQDSSA